MALPLSFRDYSTLLFRSLIRFTAGVVWQPVFDAVKLLSNLIRLIVCAIIVRPDTIIQINKKMHSADLTKLLCHRVL